MSKIYVITDSHSCGDAEVVAAFAIHADAEAFCNKTYMPSGYGFWKTETGNSICIDEVDFIGTVTSDETLL